jgi:methyl-accepting chemotaxis protein
MSIQRIARSIFGSTSDDARSARTARREAFDALSTPVVLTDPRHVIVSANDAARRLFVAHADKLREFIPSFDAAELIGLSLGSLIRAAGHGQRAPEDEGADGTEIALDLGDVRLSLRFGVSKDGAGNADGFVVEALDESAQVQMARKLSAIDGSMAVIQFTPDGHIIDANSNFLAAVGYSRQQVRGQHHSMFCDPVYAQSNEYRAFWSRLGRGEAFSGQFSRRGKDGKEIWIEASYMPVVDDRGRVERVVKIATDITAKKLVDADREGQLAAIGRAQAVIEFTPDGRILGANENFLAAVGYAQDEVKGNHHAMFCRPEYRQSQEYKSFWEKLGRGEYLAGEFLRVGKGGRELWLSATYNPIFDASGKLYKVVKYATDITAQKLETLNFEGQISAINRSQAVIEFTTDGTILRANNNFLATLGYSMDEIKGQHHAIFCDPGYRQSVEYKAFWDALAHGQFKAGKFKRIAKGGQPVWIQASYNPVMGADGKPIKVVKYASDITEQVLAAEALRDAVAETGAVIGAARSHDLTKRIDVTGKSGDIRALCEGVNGLLDAMNEILRTIAESSEAISVASREISVGNSDLSQRTADQASSLEETSASLEELSATVKQNADNAVQASNLAASASDIATRGGSVVKAVVTTMDGIAQSSRRINDIIAVIDGIAFQTNILALNAAVEAARAGEQGRGFAVVASEVRNLAQRSAEAARESKLLITDSVEKVGAGTQLVASAGQTMDEIVEAVRRVKQIMADISGASQEQSAGLEQVSTAVSQMDKITQQNAALVEETATAAASMEARTDALTRIVEGFTLVPDGAPVMEPLRVAEAARALPKQASPAAAARQSAASPPDGLAPSKVMAASKASAEARRWREF